MLKVETLSMSAKDLYSFIEKKDRESFARTMLKIRKMDDTNKKTMLLNHMVDSSYHDAGREVEFYANGIANTFTKHFKGESDYQETVLSSIKEAIGMIEEEDKNDK